MAVEGIVTLGIGSDPGGVAPFVLLGLTANPVAVTPETAWVLAPIGASFGTRRSAAAIGANLAVRRSAAVIGANMAVRRSAAPVGAHMAVRRSAAVIGAHTGKVTTSLRVYIMIDSDTAMAIDDTTALIGEVG